ncbi:MAG: hypothetical protein WAL29_08150, partial [Bacteroidales bacterium]
MISVAPTGPEDCDTLSQLGVFIYIFHGEVVEYIPNGKYDDPAADPRVILVGVTNKSAFTLTEKNPVNNIKAEKSAILYQLNWFW